MLFTVYNYFRNPQEALDKRQAVDQVGVDGKATMLAQQVQWEKESTIARFEEMTKMIGATTAMAQNHIHTVDTKVDSLIGVVNALSNEVTKLATIIDERVPKKSV